MSETVITTVHLTKEYVRDEFHVLALKDVSMEIARGEFVAARRRNFAQLQDGLRDLEEHLIRAKAESTLTYRVRVVW